ncbi:MAG: glycoside hydrolase family 127 protein [Clostridia bacterium]
MKNPLEKNQMIDSGVVIDDAFWTPKLSLFSGLTLRDTFTKLEKDGALENYQHLTANEPGKHKACPWHDGLLLETIRGAADYLLQKDDPEIVARIDGYVELIRQAQLASGGGYLSTYTQLERPQQRYGENGGNLLYQHDLYNNGALFEAGVHYYLATHKIALLECALRSANELADTIGLPPKKWIVPGHSLPEYALLELYQLVCDHPEIAKETDVPVRAEAYHQLVNFWVHGRGHHQERTNHPQYMGEYAQDHAPVEHQCQAVGQAVRATLYYTGVTRLAMLENDKALLNDSMRLWNNVETRKMHINAGVGATHFEEKFGEDYDLVNTAYLETCATVGLIFWAESLSRATGDARYFQTIERALYNLMLSSVSLQGDSYFYRNPLTSEGNDHHWAWHGCPCCPPMIHKTFGRLNAMIYAQDEDSVYVNLLMGSTLKTKLAGADVCLRASTELPWQGHYAITVEEAGQPFTLRLRQPYWAADLAWRVNGTLAAPKLESGYAVFQVRKGDVISFDDSLPTVRIEAHPYVRCDRGRVALSRGQMIYCVEGVDNHGQADLTLAEEPLFRAVHQPELLGGVTVIHGVTAQKDDFTAVPLYAWDNRMAGKMNVWLTQAGKPDTWSVTGWQDRLYRPYAGARE